MSKPFAELLATITALRAPGGCPWDQKQDLVSASRYLMDEAGELVEAALANDKPGAAEELADLLFMVCFCTEILGEQMEPRGKWRFLSFPRTAHAQLSRGQMIDKW